MHQNYTAKLTTNADEIIENSDDNLDSLITWVQKQMETSMGEMQGDIIDNKTHQVVKHFQFSPPE